MSSPYWLWQSHWYLSVTPFSQDYCAMICIDFLQMVQLRRMPHVEQNLLTLSEHMRTPPAFVGVRVAQSSMLCHVYYYLSVCLFILSHGVVSLFSIYEFDYSSGICRLSLLLKFILKNIFFNKLIRTCLLLCD